MTSEMEGLETMRSDDQRAVMQGGKLVAAGLFLVAIIPPVLAAYIATTFPLAALALRLQCHHKQCLKQMCVFGFFLWGCVGVCECMERFLS